MEALGPRTDADDGAGGSAWAPLLSVVIPVYNERATIAEVVRRVAAVSVPARKEIIVVDDGSTDGTAEALQEVGGSFTLLYASPVNAGKGSAVRTGLALASGDVILIQDADLELDPGEYGRMLAPILAGEASVVYGSRFLSASTNVPRTRRLANQLLTSATNALYATRLTDMETAYKVFTRRVASRLVLESMRFEIEPEITAQIALAGFEIVEVPISYRPRTALEGKKIRWHDGCRALWTLARLRARRRALPAGDACEIE
jgi:glycosyltransferase involved in cell wall biosynthesis